MGVEPAAPPPTPSKSNILNSRPICCVDLALPSMTTISLMNSRPVYGVGFFFYERHRLDLAECSPGSIPDKFSTGLQEALPTLHQIFERTKVDQEIDNFEESGHAVTCIKHGSVILHFDQARGVHPNPGPPSCTKCNATRTTLLVCGVDV